MDDRTPASSASGSPVPPPLPPRLPPRPSSQRVPDVQSVQPPPLPPRSSHASDATVKTSLDVTPIVDSTFTTSPSPALSPDVSPVMDPAQTPPTMSTTLPSEASPSVMLSDNVSKADLPLADVKEPTEAELREEYDNQEIEKYLALFSAITEVRLPGHGKTGLSPIPSTENVSQTGIGGDDGMTDETTPKPESSTTHAPPSCLSERVARDFILPYLPENNRPPPAPFSIGRLRVAVQRMYVIADMGYLPLVLFIIRLATWKDFGVSARWCAAFWCLWAMNMLTPSIFAGLLFLLLKKRIAPYPSRKQLRMHVEKMADAQEFGAYFQATLLRPYDVGVKDVLLLGRMLPGAFRKHEKKKLSTTPSTSVVDLLDAKADVPPVVVENPDGEVEALADLNTLSLLEVETVALRVLSDLADLNERVLNLYMWKNPRISSAFGFILLGLFLITFLVPTEYLVKIALGAAGFTFWHVVPVLIALGPEGRDRLPPPLEGVPTDAEVALELISRRVAQGLPVLPQKRRKHRSDRSASTASQPNSPDMDSHSIRSVDGEDKKFSWTKLGDRVAEGKSLAGTAKRLVTNKTDTQAPAEANAKTYPAQHKRGPGLITITPTHLYFTMLHSLSPSLTIPIGECTGIKKKGMLKGLEITWRSQDEHGNVQEHEDVFRWIGGRDEVFARLLGSDGRKWQNL